MDLVILQTADAVRIPTPQTTTIGGARITVTDGATPAGFLGAQIVAFNNVTIDAAGLITGDVDIVVAALEGTLINSTVVTVPGGLSIATGVLNGTLATLPTPGALISATDVAGNVVVVQEYNAFDITTIDMRPPLGDVFITGLTYTIL